MWLSGTLVTAQQRIRLYLLLAKAQGHNEEAGCSLIYKGPPSPSLHHMSIKSWLQVVPPQFAPHFLLPVNFPLYWAL